MIRAQLQGKRIGQLLVVALSTVDAKASCVWLCRCDCGRETRIPSNRLLGKRPTRSCGCLRDEAVRKRNRATHRPTRQDLVGRRFSRLTVTAFVGIRGAYQQSVWRCRCDCGREKIVSGSNLRSDEVRSCGCLIRDTVRGRCLTHGKTHTPEYRIWLGMKARCADLRDKRYGGRGIAVCDRWRTSFEAFLRDMGTRPTPEHSLDRLENARGYEPGNVRWATRLEQGRNTSRNRLITIGDVTLPLSAWAERLGVKYMTLHSRLRRGMPIAPGHDIASD